MMALKPRSSFVLLIGVALCFQGKAVWAKWPEPASRSGVSLPENKIVAAALGASGLYLKNTEGDTHKDAGMAEGTLTWNLGLPLGFGLFGQHSVLAMVVDDWSFLSFGHEVGGRFIIPRYLSFELAYLSHRVEYEWLKGDPWSFGGVYDHGVEFGIWGRLELLHRLRIEPHVFGRYFGEPNPKDEDQPHHYSDNIWVLGLELAMGVLITQNFALHVHLKALRSYRTGDIRADMERKMWNVLGIIEGHISIIENFGIALGARVASRSFVGERPMFELSRSGYEQPTASITAGIFFSF